MKSANRIASVVLLVGACGAQCLSASIVVTPSTIHLNPGQGVQFTATGSSLGVYLWSLSGPGCQGASCGLISSQGVYTAPSIAPTPSTVTITATSLLDLSQFGTATVTVSGQPVISVVLAPQQVSIPLGSKQQFTPTVAGTANTAVTWALSGYGCAGSACGTITSSGSYTAPTTMPPTGIVFVTATSMADSTKSGMATVYFNSAVTVSVSPTSPTLKLGATQQFKATVSGTNSTGVNWSISGTGCADAACGTITSAGLYTAPKTAPTPPTVTVEATSTADRNAFAKAIVNFQVPIGITIMPTAASLVAGGHYQFSDTVVGASDTAVNWSVSGTGCSGSACGTISAGGLYVAPATITGQLNVTVKVTTQATPSASATANVTVLVSDNAKLSGHYAFLFNGFDNNGVYQVAGSIDADGEGNIPSGTEDVNYTVNPAADLSISGTYGVTSDNRGTLTIKGPLGTQTLCMTLDASGAMGRLISCDQSGIRGSGVIYLQNASAFHTSSLSKGYVVSLTGSNLSGARVGALGLFFPNGAGLVNGASLDVNQGGNTPPTFPGFSGTYAVSSTGRGTMTWKVPGFDGGLFHFTFYVVSQQKLLLISMDPISSSNPIFSGPANLQVGAPFFQTSFFGASIFNMSGPLNGKTDNMIGRIQFDSDGSVGVSDDRNSAGTVSLGQVISGAYDLEIDGRGDLNLDCGCTWVFYATAPNQGFVMDTSSEVRMGEMIPQIHTGLTSSSILNTYMLGSGSAPVKPSSLYSGSISFVAGNTTLGTGAVVGTLGVSQSSALLLNQAIQGTTSLSLVSVNGHGAIQFTAPQKLTLSLWVASPSQAIGPASGSRCVICNSY